MSGRIMKEVPTPWLITIAAALFPCIFALIWATSPKSSNNVEEYGETAELSYKTVKIGWRPMVGEAVTDERSGVSWVMVAVDGDTNNLYYTKRCFINLVPYDSIEDVRYWRKNPTNGIREAYVYMVRPESAYTFRYFETYFIMRNPPLME